MRTPKRSWLNLRSCLAAIAASLACATWAQTEPANPHGESVGGSAGWNAGSYDGSKPASTRQYAIRLDPYSNAPQWDLRGVDARRGVAFGVREDQHIRGLTLDLAYTYSSALLENLSHLNVLLNGGVIATLPLPARSATSLNRTQIDLPVAGLEPYNVLELQLIGHYTMGCENPLHQDLWVSIDQSSKLVFDAEPRALPDDLGILPVPFFDARDLRMQKMAFILGRPSDRRLEAAGILASWLGALASYRGTEISIASEGIPSSGHAIIVLGPNESLPGVDLPSIQGPTLAMRTNPNDLTGKLLLVMGRDDDEIRKAAVSLALGAQTLSGPTVQAKDIQAEPRKPYDAPNWLPTDRPVYLGELLPSGDMTVAGFDPPPISMGVRLPPDLSGWRTLTVPMDLRYRYTPLSKVEDSTLVVLINQQFVQEVKLGDSYEGAWGALTQVPGIASQTIPLPLPLLESQAQLQFQFKYPTPLRTECGGSMLDTRHSGIDPQSTIDLTGLPHHMAMPDLAAFRTAGFPYSRMADLSESVVLLSQNAGTHEIATFLTILGKIGQTTGYPATGLTVRREANDLEEKDLLLIATDDSTGILARWRDHIPAPAPETTQSDWWTSLKRFFTTNPFSHQTPLPLTRPVNGVYVAGFESPVTSGRSVVVVAGEGGQSMQEAVQFMLFDDDQAQEFQGSLVSVRNDRIESLSTAQTYYVGSLGVFQSVLWFLSDHPGILFVIFLVGAVLTAVVLYLSLRARAQSRLLVGSPSAHQPNDNV
ncbi:cellulose biosynthesis cyclic di-GMP-binding regulatory protein BcsB [Orrella marina]|nr:cellulose biosynthesis cyclic di-GMP-binding regulatory protein BcsB [Orrella marina]